MKIVTTATSLAPVKIAIFALDPLNRRTVTMGTLSDVVTVVTVSFYATRNFVWNVRIVIAFTTLIAVKTAAIHKT